MNFQDWQQRINQFGAALRAAAQAGLTQRPPAPPPAPQNDFYPHLAFQDSAPASKEDFLAQSLDPSGWGIATHASWPRFEAQARPSQLIEDHRRFMLPPAPAVSPTVPYLMPGSRLPGFGSQ
jgi:hypothetical protein